MVGRLWGCEVAVAVAVVCGLEIRLFLFMVMGWSGLWGELW